MTAPDVVELGRRAVACARFRWEPGMLDTHGRRAVDDREIPAWHDEGKSCEPYNASGCYEPRGDAVPDLADAATLGALLGLVREAYKDQRACAVAWDANSWVVLACLHGDAVPDGVAQEASEAAALVCALEAAPVRS